MPKPGTPGSRLTRKLQPMPSLVRRALTEGGLTAVYRRRPAHQQKVLHATLS